MQTPGPTPLHSLSLAQARQRLVVGLQTGVAPEQVLLSVHWTHAPLAAQAESAASTLAHCPGLVQPTHVCDAEQMGVVPEQWLLVRHCTHLLAAVSQTGLLPGQVELSVHSTQAPLAAHAGRAGWALLHSAAVAHGTHLLVPIPQMGVAVGQSVPARHCTHRLAAVSQTGAPAGQVAPSTHSTQVPAVEQAGCAGSLAAHSAPLAQLPHEWLVEQIGALVGQLVELRHCTHFPLATSHTEVAPAQVELSVHWTQAPLAPQAGRPGSSAAH
jgi:hypothetical protein